MFILMIDTNGETVFGKTLSGEGITRCAEVGGSRLNKEGEAMRLCFIESFCML